ncbi:hypothetical protein [Specibacter cremeus]|uniref:hypothetical protein n=1 Tax=Specibacter cremeus TaxID=1629051 RepID=UPI000F79EBB0|nr:hypothetical protein [Specibacter cremeus]
MGPPGAGCLLEATAHPAKGITVDTSHTALAQGHLTREPFYVGMTRGRTGNTAYVCESNPASDEATPSRPAADWLQIIGEVLAAAAHLTNAIKEMKYDDVARLQR